MGLHIEISGDADPREWQGVKALAMVMLGEISAGALMAATVDHIDPFRPDPPLPPVAVAAVPAPPTATPEPPTPPSPSETLLAQTAAAATPVVPTSTGVDLDVNGLPHDLRIHSAERTKNKDLSWRIKRGTDKALIATVEADLRQAMAAGAAAAAPPPPAITDAAAAFGATPLLAAEPPAPPPVVPVAAEPTPEPPAASPVGMVEFARVMRVVVAKQAAGTLTTEATTTIAQSLGLASIRDLAHRPDLVPAFEALLP